MKFTSTIKEFLELHLTIALETSKEYCCYCPFHQNNDTPALSVNKTTGLWHCFNPTCGAKGNINTLSLKLTGKPLKNFSGVKNFTEEEILQMLEEVAEKETYEDILEKITINYRNPEEVSKLQYLIDRGFNPAILEYFEICYSEKQKRIVIPARDENYSVVGFIGRSTDEETKPKYKYTDGMPRGGMLYNLNNAKQYNSVIVTEGSLDAIKVHQAGFPNVVATLGATVTPTHLELLNQYFNEITIFSDNDEAGNNMRRGIISKCNRKQLWLVSYPDGVKDPGELSQEQIRYALENKTDYLDYLFNN